MRKLFLILTLLSIQLQIFATESTDYLSDLYSKNYKTQVRIISKNEYIDKYDEKIGEIIVPTITHGLGYMQIDKHKKIKISYICLFNSDGNIFWGYAIPR